MVKIAPFGSAAQVQSIALRFEVLRKPLGLVFSPLELLAEGDEVHLIYQQGSFVTGCMLLKPISHDTLKMRQVAVHPNFQKQGIGQAMVRFAEEYATQNSFSKMELHARDSAVPFYLNLNYTIIGDGFEEVGIPHHKMVKGMG